jgi:hypothetical protein
MSKRYRWNIPGKNFKLITPQTAKEIWSSVKRCSSSIRYDAANKRVILVSTNIADITNAIERGIWEHSRKPSRIGNGWKGYIVPSKEAMTSMPDLAHGAEFDITGEPTASDSNKPEWQSEVGE